MHGQVLIRVHENKFEILPKHEFPIVTTPFGELEVVVDWSQNGDKWASITIGNFQVVGVPPGYYQANPKDCTISKGDGKKYTFDFSPPLQLGAPDHKCTYDVTFVLEADSTKSYTLDPVIILRPEGSITPP